jgi:dihydrofolate reductase
MIKMIVAYDENRVIGFNNTIPWRNPEDMKLFKTRTTGNTIVMGRKTWESFPKRPLPNRVNIVLSNKDHEPMPGVFFVKTFDEAINHPSIVGDVYIIGGAQIYKYALETDKVDQIEVSLIPGTHEGDTYFPDIDANEKWTNYSVKNYETFKQVVYVRAKNAAH